MNFKKYKHRSLAWLPLFSFALLLAAPGRADVWLIDVKGTIGPASADHMVRGLAAAQQNAAELVVLRIDTPGGLDLSMREMIKAILAAQVPVVGYVAPSGARAASAGTYLLYATQIAAMAPGTNLGTATTIQLGAPAVPQMPDAPAESQQWFSDLQRKTTSAENAAAILEAHGDVDIRDLLGKVTVPTLVIHSRHDAGVPFDQGQELAVGIPGARFAVLDTNNHILPATDPAWDRCSRLIEEFLAE